MVFGLRAMRRAVAFPQQQQLQRRSFVDSQAAEFLARADAITKRQTPFAAAVKLIATGPTTAAAVHRVPAFLNPAITQSRFGYGFKGILVLFPSICMFLIAAQAMEVTLSVQQMQIEHKIAMTEIRAEMKEMKASREAAVQSTAAIVAAAKQ